MKRYIRSNSETIVSRFEVGKIYDGVMLYGGRASYKVIDRTSNTVTLQESHISEDTWGRVFGEDKEYHIELLDKGIWDDDDNYIIVGKEEAVQIWEYRGHQGYLCSSDRG